MTEKGMLIRGCVIITV